MAITFFVYMEGTIVDVVVHLPFSTGGFVEEHTQNMAGRNEGLSANARTVSMPMSKI
jgi:hypothetical protein